MTLPSQDRVILVSSGNRSGAENIPLGLMSLATSMRHVHNIKTQIIDLPIENPGYIDSQISIFWDDINLDNVLFVGFATVCGTIPRTLSLARELRWRHPTIPIVFGGPDASSHPQILLQAYSFIDAVVVGEAEGVLADLLHSLRVCEWKSRPGLYFRDNANGDFLGATDIVDLTKIDPVDYSNYPLGLKDECVALDVGRGCPFSCTFCSTNNFFRRNFRMKPTERIIEEVVAILRNPYVRKIEFVHDMFTINRKLVVEICRTITDMKLLFEWTCSSRTDSVDRELLELMHNAGCSHIYFGIDTGSERLQRAIRKKLDLVDAEQTLEISLELGISITVAVLIGFPNEEERDLIDTLNFAIRWGARSTPGLNVQVHLVTPMAGTELTEEYGETLLYDAYVGARMVVCELTEWEEQQVRRNPQLFQSFYYCRNPHVSRSVYKWIHNALTTGQIKMTDVARLAQIRGENPGNLLLHWAKSMPSYPVKGGRAYQMGGFIPMQRTLINALYRPSNCGF